MFRDFKKTHKKKTKNPRKAYINVKQFLKNEFLKNIKRKFNINYINLLLICPKFTKAYNNFSLIYKKNFVKRTKEMIIINNK